MARKTLLNRPLTPSLRCDGLEPSVTGVQILVHPVPGGIGLRPNKVRGTADGAVAAEAPRCLRAGGKLLRHHARRNLLRDHARVRGPGDDEVLEIKQQLNKAEADGGVRRCAVEYRKRQIRPVAGPDRLDGGRCGR